MIGLVQAGSIFALLQSAGAGGAGLAVVIGWVATSAGGAGLAVANGLVTASAGVWVWVWVWLQQRLVLIAERTTTWAPSADHDL
jgi:hypothetical protein